MYKIKLNQRTETRKQNSHFAIALNPGKNFLKKYR